MEPDYRRNASFHDQLASRYDSHLEGVHNALARTAFHDLVARYVPPGSTILDFGCGTGIDADYYATCNYRVLAYDNSAGMVDELSRRCNAGIAAGLIRTCTIPYPAFPAGLPRWPAPNAITANFAVLNSIRDLPPLFDQFANLLAPPGWVILSVLNPLHWSKLRMPSAANGPRPFQTEPYESYLHSIPSILRAATRFELIGRAQAGAIVRYQDQSWHTKGVSPSLLQRVLWRSPARRLLGHFVFLVLRRSR